MCQVLASRPVNSRTPPAPPLDRRVALLEAQSIFMKRRLAETSRRLQKSDKLSRRIPHLEAALASATGSIEHLETRLDSLESHVEDLKQDKSRLAADIRNTRRREQRAKKASQQKLDYLQDHDMMAMRADLAAAETNATEALSRLDESLRAREQLNEQHSINLQKIRDSQKRIHALQKQCARAPGILAKAIARAEAKGCKRSHLSAQRRLRSKGGYTAEARALMRQLVKSGCAPSMVGKVMTAVSSFAGKRLDCNISRRTVQRAILEGGIAAKIQLGYEIATAKCNVFSSLIPVLSLTVNELQH